MFSNNVFFSLSNFREKRAPISICTPTANDLKRALGERGYNLDILNSFEKRTGKQRKKAENQRGYVSERWCFLFLLDFKTKIIHDRLHVRCAFLKRNTRVLGKYCRHLCIRKDILKTRRSVPIGFRSGF